MNLTRLKSGIWQVELRVPVDVRHVLGKTRFAKSTKTQDKRTAMQRLPVTHGSARRRPNASGCWRLALDFLHNSLRRPLSLPPTADGPDSRSNFAFFFCDTLHY